MEEFKGTKGEWSIGKYNSVVVATERVRNSNFPTPPNPEYSTDEYKEEYGGYLICESIGNKEDAHIIASAPELLEASMAALRFMQKTGINYDNADIYNSLNSAINKALGK